MNINSYSIYSAVSAAENQSENELIKILELTDKFNEIEDIDKAKECLEELWHVNKPVQALPVSSNCVLTTKENDRGFCINFSCNDENISYYYKK